MGSAGCNAEWLRRQVEAMQARGRGCVIGGTALIEPAVRNMPYPNRVVATSDCFYVEFQLAELSKVCSDSVNGLLMGTRADWLSG